MPYVAAIDLLTKTPVEDRAKLDPHIFALADKMRRARSIQDLKNLAPEIRALTDVIGELAIFYKYEGAFAGELNYSLHMILFAMMPGTRYWIASDITGMLEELLFLFHTSSLTDVVARYRKEMETSIPFGEDRAFVDILEWAFVHVARHAAPDDRRRTKRFILGVLRHIDTELYRRLWTLYEELQIEKNGDVPGYVLWRGKTMEAIAKLREERADTKT